MRLRRDTLNVRIPEKEHKAGSNLLTCQFISKPAKSPMMLGSLLLQGTNSPINCSIRKTKKSVLLTFQMLEPG